MFVSNQELNHRKYYYKCLNCNEITVLLRNVGKFSFDNEVKHGSKVKCPYCGGNMERAEDKTVI